MGSEMCIRDSSVSELRSHFGMHGGRFIPETLLSAHEELEAVYVKATADPAFRAEVRRRDFLRAALKCAVRRRVGALPRPLLRAAALRRLFFFSFSFLFPFASRSLSCSAATLSAATRRCTLPRA